MNSVSVVGSLIALSARCYEDWACRADAARSSSEPCGLTAGAGVKNFAVQPAADLRSHSRAEPAVVIPTAA